MKKACLFFTSALLCTLFFFGCHTELNPAPTTEPTTEPITEPTTEPVAIEPEWPWLMSYEDALTYEEYFAQEREFSRGGSVTSRYEPRWFVPETEESYVIHIDSAGIHICSGYGELTVHYTVPGSELLSGLTMIVTDGESVFGISNKTELVRVDLLSGEVTVLHSADRILGMLTFCDRTLFFLARMDDTMTLNRLYLPSMTLDVLYTGEVIEVPDTWFEIQIPKTNQSVIKWETMNPSFWVLWMEIAGNPNHEYRKTDWGQKDFLWDPSYFEEYPFKSGDLHYYTSKLQEPENIRPRMLCVCDPVSGNYTEKYGIYDICDFGSGMGHTEDDHFATYPEFVPIP